MEKDDIYQPAETLSETLKDDGFKLAFRQLDQILSKLTETPDLPQNDALFISTCLEFARISFILGKGFNRLISYLKQGLHVAERIGDQRSKALMTLHLGRLFYFSEQHEKAMASFTAGKSLVDSLGDEDITAQAAEFVGLFYFIQGYFKKARVFFEKATQSFEFGKYGHSGPMWLSYCYAFLGQYDRAIGTVDYYRRMARERGKKPLSTTLRAVLGIFLVRIKKLQEASYHLSGALQDASQEKNYIAEYFSRGGLAFYHLTEGRMGDSKEWLESALSFGQKLGLVKQYASPFVLEIISEYHRRGIAPIENFTFEEESRRISQGVNIHLGAVALRLIAADGLVRGEDIELIRSHLLKSEKQLKLSGDPIQLAKTRLELARLSLKQHDQKEARKAAQQAWKNFSGYGDIFYPDDLRFLLAHKDDIHSDYSERESTLQRFTDMIDELVSSDNLSELLLRAIKATNRFLGAERGGIFLFEGSEKKTPPKLLAAHNLSEADTSETVFRSSLELIFKAYHENRPLVRHKRKIETVTGRIRAMIAIPFEVKNQAGGILYHDNAYINDCFNHYSKGELTGMANSLSKYVNYLLNLNRRLEEKASSNYKRMGETRGSEIIAESTAMKKLLTQVDRIAVTDSTVLLTGETGVGKEVLARRIHQKSTRNNHPLVIVDPTTIPETLFESELFGHEKGAFTGAERQKTGRIELAHRGTLFIDEIGEIPLSIQVKLLRSLQEKTIVRVGGVQTIVSDFRLIAATNRDLRQEIQQGRFREDLYYRINVIPFNLPPLRKRGDDVVLLSQSFLEKYRSKYKQPDLELTKWDQEILLSYEWPGNIRELKNVIERAVLLAEDNRLTLDLVKDTSKFSTEKLFHAHPSLDDLQRMYIHFILEECGGKIGGQGGAAERLGMKRTSLYARMRTLGMR